MPYGKKEERRKGRNKELKNERGGLGIERTETKNGYKHSVILTSSIDNFPSKNPYVCVTACVLLLCGAPSYASLFLHDIVLGLSGSVACIKVHDLVAVLLEKFEVGQFVLFSAFVSFLAFWSP